MISILLAAPLLLTATCAPEPPTCAIEEVRLEAPVPTPGDRFGHSVDVDGDTLVVGAPRAMVPPHWTGAAFVYARQSGTWVLQAELLAPFPHPQDFGWAVAVDGDRIVVGARTSGVMFNNAGSAFVFVRSGSTWAQEAHLVASDPQAAAFAGQSVDIDGDTVVMGAFGKSETIFAQGAAYVFVRNGPTWSQQAKLTSFPSEWFGWSVAVDGDTIAVGAPRSGVSPWSGKGRAFVFERSGTAWSQQGSLVAGDLPFSQEYGWDVDVEGDVLAVGTNGSWKAHIARRSVGGTWNETAILQPAGPPLYFGWSVSLDGPRLAVSAPRQPTPGGQGEVFLFADTGTGWVEEFRLDASPSGSQRPFGQSVVLRDGELTVGAMRYQSSSADPGAVHAFRLAPPPDSYCAGKTNSLGCIPFLTTTGAPRASGAGDFRITARDLIPGQAGTLVYGFAKANQPFHGGTFCVKLPWRRVPTKAAAATGTPPCSGRHHVEFNQRVRSGTDPLLTAGQQVFVQGYQRDAADPAGFGDSLTDAVSFTVCP